MQKLKTAVPRQVQLGYHKIGRLRISCINARLGATNMSNRMAGMF